MSIINTTDADFDKDVLQADKPVLLDFWAPRCGPCVAIAPILEELDAEYGDKFQIVKINVDIYPEIATRFGIRAIPTLFVFKQGEKVDGMTGRLSKNGLLEFMGRHVAL